MNTSNHEKVIALRRQLHACPELSNNEKISMETIHDFLKENTSLSLERYEGWLLATHFEGESLPYIGFRGDMDAISDGCGGARHGCGHDGHSATLCGLGLELEGKKLGKNVCLIFQPAEETGEGAKMICDTWPGLKKLSRVYGLHNIPGHPKGALLMRDDCFACASRGLIVRVVGSPAHAAYPGDGANPSELLSSIVLETPGMIDEILDGADRLLMRTIIGLNIGGENFGLSASEGQLCMTLRAHRQADIEALQRRIEEFTRAGCEAQGMNCSFEERDVFPDTTNHASIVAEVRSIWNDAQMTMKDLAEPMRWSEDFGWYLKNVPGMFFGVGTGENAPGLHTAEYEFDDSIIETAVNAFYKLI